MIEYDFEKPFSEQSEEVKIIVYELVDKLAIETQEECLSHIMRPITYVSEGSGIGLRREITYVNIPTHPAFMARVKSKLTITQGETTQTIEL